MATAPLPFAHPFFTNVPPARRAPDPRFGARMTAFAQDHLEPIPDLTPDPVWTLADVIGPDRANQIAASGAIGIHAVGDTGAGKFPIVKNRPPEFGVITPAVEEAQIAVARAMNGDLDASHPETSPAFFLHLGDVIYFDNTPTGYHEQFYVPYQEYNGKIIAIPGNHDGEVFLGHQSATLIEFQKNFCPREPSVPPDANPVLREMSAQPGVYWWLQAPFLDLIGLYSNTGEGPGFIRGPIPGEHQYDWLKTALDRIAAARRAGTRQAFVLAVHHPPLTATLFGDTGDGHSPSDGLRSDLDAAFNGAGVWPDAILSAHAHSYQHFTRFVEAGGQERDVPYLVAGGGGRTPQAVLDGQGQLWADKTVRFDSGSHGGHGYLLVTAAPGELRIAYRPVSGPPALPDNVVVPL